MNKIAYKGSTFLKKKQTGFTLIEVLVATTILATLVGGVLLSLNPLGQINKSQDTQRQSDIREIKTALDLYYSDHKCYPPQVPFGSEWSATTGGVKTIYMKKVPQDPKCSARDQASCYKYTTDTASANNCPQWNVVFSQLSKASSLANACPLSSLSNCTPAGYSNGGYACVLSGGVDCTNLASTSIIGGDVPSTTSAPTPTPTSTGPTPTPTPDPNDVTFTLPQDTNPDPYEVTLNPLYPNPAAAQTFKVKVEDPGTNITSVELVITSDGGAQRSVFLNPPTGAINNAGTWTGTRQVGNQETFYNLYALEIIIKAGSGPSQIVGYESLSLRAAGIIN
jgi:prepilin-type N-terminal cleavage/methylation domain-containing protein